MEITETEAGVRCPSMTSPYAVGPITCQLTKGHEGDHRAWQYAGRKGNEHSWPKSIGATGFCVVCYPGSEAPRVDTYSGGCGDIYTTREEAEDILFLTRVCMKQHRPLDRYELAELRIIPIREGDERRAVPSDPFYDA